MPNLEKVFVDTLKVIEKSREQIYEIADNARTEGERVKKELMEIQEQVLATINKTDKLEQLEKYARRRLMEVSRGYGKYSEEEMREAYDKARELQVELGTLRERESQLKLRRNELERTLRKMQNTVEKAEVLMTQVSVVLDYLGGSLKKLNNQLAAANQRRYFAPKIIQAQEEERKRVAREIHDGPAQSMANVVLRTEICEQLLDSDQEAARRELRELRGIVRNSLQDVRRIIFDLRPMALDDLGLIPALLRYMETLKDRYGIPIEVICAEQKRRLNPLYEIAIYRVVQEAVQNTIKHAQASRIVVRLEIEDQYVTVFVSDDGVGFEYEEYIQEPRAESYGLIGMKERLDIIGGQLTIKSQVGKGTEILAILPLD